VRGHTGRKPFNFFDDGSASCSNGTGAELLTDMLSKFGKVGVEQGEPPEAESPEPPVQKGVPIHVVGKASERSECSIG
jgi:hypothetical protein